MTEFDSHAIGFQYPEFILMLDGTFEYLDGDEILEDNARSYIRLLMKNLPGESPTTVRFKYINLWRSRKVFRFDKWYAGEAGKLFRVTKDLTSYGTAFNNHHYAYSKPDDFGIVLSPDLNILHYAWVDWEHQVRKVERYAKIEHEKNGTPIEVARIMFNEILDERGIKMSMVFKDWQEEYRSGKIQYNKIEK